MRVQEIVIDVSGMTGPDCEKQVSEALMAVPGVRAVRTDHVQGRAVVTGDSDVAAPDALCAAINRAGYVPGEVSFAE